MSLTKEEFLTRLRNRECKYLFGVPVLATPNENYLEWACNYIFENELKDDKLNGIDKITRSATYNTKRESSNNNTNSNRREEHLVLDLYVDRNEQYVKNIFGEILNYQVPLKNSDNDKGIKAIDFINVRDNTLYLSEIKYQTSNESILKAILEIQTYYQIIDHNKLKKDFNLNDNVDIRKSVIIFDGTKAEEQLKDIRIKKLIELFEIDIIVIRIAKIERVN